MSNTITSLASTLTQAVNEVQKGIVETQEQLASGKATLNAAESGVVSRLTAQVEGYKSVGKNLTDAGSAINVAQSALSSVSDILSQLKGLATQASSAGFASSDRDSLNQTFQNLINQIDQLVTSASVNGANLLNTDFGLQITTGIDGTADSQTQVSATNVKTLVDNLKDLLITGLQIDDLHFPVSNLTTPVSTITSNSGNPPTATTPTTTITTTGTSSATQVETITFPNLNAGASFTANGLTLQLTSDMTGSQLATAFAAKMTSSSATTTYGNWSGTITRAVGTSASNAVLTCTNSGGDGVVAQLVLSKVSGTQTQTIALSTANMAQGNSIRIGNLTFTAGPGPGNSAGGISPQQVTAAIVAYVNSGVIPDPSIGTFTNNIDAVVQQEKLTFVGLKNTDTFTAGGLTFTANTNVTAEQVTAAFLAKITNASTPNPSYGAFTGSLTSGIKNNPVNCGGSTTSLTLSYDPSVAAGLGAIPTSLVNASYTIQTLNNGTGSASSVTTSILRAGVNANTGTKLTGGSAAGISASVLSANTFSLTTADPLTTGTTPATAGSLSLVSSTSNTTYRNTLTFTNSSLLAGNANLFPGDSVTINGLTFTASQTTTNQQVLDAFKNAINSGDTGNVYGVFSNSDANGGTVAGKISEIHSLFTAFDLGGGVLALDNVSSSASEKPVMTWNTQNSAIANANRASQIITGQIDTVSTAQASLSAAMAGLEAQLKNATNIGNGMQKTIDKIANIDPTALQANLQQLNTQQSVDYYLVSQMNTAAAAILSIFR
ncbi:flagellin [Polynucleobacter sp. JS-JIR-5-A7]|uniref:flagellin N-terminal helical domain-containing protein n=1 Tax=Polynucleobacter sp. JS-JIR-5-A7 TaxID=1758395 RepID=UPI001BFCD6ED|nr:flagellin [Polynucleobacter sp. JS-JIR-5-A7]QWE07375.1 hypothetical protein AOC29_04055 [Polynucleobacter sp. JS-JIR-5-A7]